MGNKMKQLIIYHKNCQDGLFSAYQFWLKNPNAYFAGLSHHPTFKLSSEQILRHILNKNHLFLDSNHYLKDVELYIADFSLPYEVIKDFSAIFKSILIIDHHITSFKDYSSKGPIETIKNNWKKIKLFDNCEYIYSETESGAKMVYKYLNDVDNDDDVPMYIRLVSDRDMWKFKFKDTNLFYYGIDLFKPKSFKELNDLIRYKFKDIIMHGKLVGDNLNNHIKELANSQLVYISGLNTSTNEYSNGALINAELKNASEIGNYVVSSKELEYEIDFCVIFTIKKDNILCSIRSRKEFDCSIIAEKYNGGGHKNSSGFTLSLNELFDLLNNKVLRY